MSAGSESPSPPAYHFAEYRLDPARRSLTHADGSAVNIAGKPFDVLLYLVEHAGHVVDRSALMRAVWQKRVVEENNVNQIVAGLRRALGPMHIVTVAGRGYQFVTPVHAVRDVLLEPSSLGLARATSATRTTRSAHKQVRYTLAGVLVLGVAVLAATRYPAGPRGAGDTSRSEPPSTDHAQIEHTPTGSSEAYAHYRRALAERDRRRAISLLDEALKLDPTFVDALIAKAGHHLFIAGLLAREPAAPDRAAGMAALDNALKLRPTSPRAQAQLALQLGQVGQWIESQRQWDRAFELGHDPTKGAYFLLKMGVGHTADAINLMEAQLAETPLSEGPASMLLVAYETLGETAKRRDHWRRGQRLFAGSWMGDSTEAGLRLGERDTEYLRTAVETARSPALKAIWRAGADHLDSPQAGIASLQSLYADPHMRTGMNLRALTDWALYFDQPELALQWFRESLELQATGMSGAWLPWFKKVRRLPGFKELVREQGLPEYWDDYGWPPFCHRTEGSDFTCD
jgi:DNA-binding winged helix-turn-helix (wHTH) protein/tetratricopeptide (TPR) repeat protein